MILLVFVCVWSAILFVKRSVDDLGPFLSLQLHIAAMIQLKNLPLENETLD